MIYMMILDEYEIHDSKDLELFLKFLEAESLTEEQREYYIVIEKFLNNVYEKNNELQEMVYDKISEDLISCIILPYKSTDNLDEFNFFLINVNNNSVTKRQEILYHRYCDLVFGNTPGLYSSILTEYQKLYI